MTEREQEPYKSSEEKFFEKVGNHLSKASELAKDVGEKPYLYYEIAKAQTEAEWMLELQKSGIPLQDIVNVAEKMEAMDEEIRLEVKFRMPSRESNPPKPRRKFKDIVSFKRKAK